MDTNIEIANGRVFVNGKETVDLMLIGYAILDFAENMEDIGKTFLTDKDVSFEPLKTEV